MGRLLFIITFAIFITFQSVYSQHNLSGKVLNNNSKLPVEFAVVSIPDQGLWAITNEEGAFHIRSVASGKISLIISCLGYAKNTITVEDLSVLPPDNVYFLKEDNLLLDEVVVTARKKTDVISTSYTIDRNAINHIQAVGVADVLSQLPGAQTNSEKNLISERRIALRSQSTSEMDKPTFGTAIEVDGVRLSNNGAFATDATDGIEGIGTRNIAVSNIESIEVVTGLPSVEHGDLSSGLVKIKTRKGKSPYEVEIIIKPQIKSYSLNKGFDLGKSAGLINAGVEHTQSIADRSSPYTTYTRNNLSLIYRNTFGQKKRPIELTYGITGNTGGYNSESDPDAFTGTYKKIKDNVLRSNLYINWLLNRPWITNLEFSGSVNYTDKKQEEQTNKSASSATAAIHTTDEGYFIATRYDENPNAAITLIPAGYWYQLKYNDEKPVTYSSKIKASWLRKFGKVRSDLKAGGEFVYSGNYGKGGSYADMRYAPTYREFRYDKQPFVKNLALYAEEKISFPVLGKELQVQSGVRADITSIKGSDYGVVQSFSPRTNVQYTLIADNSDFVKKLSFHAGWGDAVKLPSSSILYPSPSYSDKISFAPGTLADGTVFYAYYTIPEKPIYNPGLKWQRNRKTEIGVDLRLGSTQISLTAFHDKVFHPYKETTTYTPFSYKLTDQTSLNNCIIPENNRAYMIDQNSGIVTVSDKTGQYDSQQLSYITRNTFKSNSYYTNGSPVLKKGLEWTVDFGKVQALKTSVRLDGNYFYYKGVDETMIKYLASATNMGDGNPYKYIGFYVGSYNDANGSITKKLTTNVTLTTHIPAIRIIVTIRLESCFYDYSQSLSEYSGGTRSFVLNNKDDYFQSGASSNVYAGNQYVAMYPLYYVSLDDINTLIPFAGKFLWAKENDKALYNELAKMVMKTNNNYYFNANKYSDYFSANIGLTKEIGNKISMSFQANNFFNNMGQYVSSHTENKYSLYGSTKIPSFYYGLSIRLKL